MPCKLRDWLRPVCACASSAIEARGRPPREGYACLMFLCAAQRLPHIVYACFPLPSCLPFFISPSQTTRIGIFPSTAARPPVPVAMSLWNPCLHDDLMICVS